MKKYTTTIKSSEARLFFREDSMVDVVKSELFEDGLTAVFEGDAVWIIKILETGEYIQS